MAGTKGDMLTHLLNDTDPEPRGSGRSTYKYGLKGISYLELTEKNDHIDLNTIGKRLEQNPNRFINGHELYCLHTRAGGDMLESRSYELYKLVFDKRYYQTVQIEATVKNLPNKGINPLILKFEPHKKDLLNQDSYHVDYFLLDMDAEITDANRAAYMHDRLKQLNPSRFDLFNKFGLSSKNCKVCHYHQLYIDFDIDDPVFESIGSERLKQYVEKSWLPDVIECFGETWHLARDYGYRNY
jgi:hypothetical protein